MYALSARSPLVRDGEISDAAWAVIAPLFPSAGRARGRWRDHRQVLEGIVFTFRTGLPWRDLPERFGGIATRYDKHPDRYLAAISPSPSPPSSSGYDAAQRDRT
ncbi:transposase [Streptomyces lavendofoliae]|uniref:transposase n=1 Tax=Streptomyces lavendofoliae TaxID=67314 RepID=UPI003AF1B71B